MRARRLVLAVTFSVIQVACGGGGGGGGTPDPVTYSISGTVSGDAVAGVTVALSGAASATTTTDASGNYTFAGLASGTYQVTPTMAGFTFSPASVSVTIDGASVNGRRFTAALEEVVSPAFHSISGAVSGATAAGVLVTLSGAASRTTNTDASGGYTFGELADGSYTVTPTKAGYTFSPASLAVTVSGADVTGRNFVASVVTGPILHAIRGSVTGDARSGVTVTLSGAENGTTITDAGGSYTFGGLANGRTYTVTPSKAGYTFTPPTRQVTLAGADATGQDFAAVPVAYSISGAIGGETSSDVTVTLSGAASRTTSTGAGGAFTFAGLASGSYTLTPTKAGYAFTPSSASVAVSGANVTGQAFSAVDLETANWPVAAAAPGPNDYTVDVAGDTVTDGATGLVWRRRASDARYTWSEAKSHCASLGAGWRLPTMLELASIVDYGASLPAIDASAFPDTSQDAMFWSATADAELGSAYAWLVAFGYGDAGVLGTGERHLARCVRLGTRALPQGARYTAGAVSVTANATGLVWQRQVAPTALSYQDAVSYCASLNLDASTGWRLPTLKELQSILRMRAYSPSIDAVAFPGTPSAPFWSSTPDAEDPNFAWIVEFEFGRSTWWDRTQPLRVRCVR